MKTTHFHVTPDAHLEWHESTRWNHFHLMATVPLFRCRAAVCKQCVHLWSCLNYGRVLKNFVVLFFLYFLSSAVSSRGLFTTGLCQSITAWKLAESSATPLTWPFSPSKTLARNPGSPTGQKCTNITTELFTRPRPQSQGHEPIGGFIRSG